jgi:hypothetical protein
MGLHHNKVLVLHLEVGGVYYIKDLVINRPLVVDCIVCYMRMLDIKAYLVTYCIVCYMFFLGDK